MSDLIICLIQSDDYKKRLLGEYLEIKERIEKLNNFLTKYKLGVLEFTPTSSLNTFQRQERLMWAYLQVLELRLKDEGIQGISTDGLEVSN